MLASTAGAEFVDHGLECRERRSAVGPDIGPMGFLLARCQHLYRRFIGVDDLLGQHRLAQRIHQWLELHAGLAHPLRQRRAGNRQTSPGKDFLLPVQRKVVGEPGHHHMGQQAGGGDALVDDLGWHRCLDQCLALAAGPLATYMLLDGKHTRGVIQLLADVFTDALKLAAAGTLGAIGLVADHGARQLRWQRSTLGLLACFVRRRGGTKCLQLSVDGFEVSVEQVIQQAALRRAYLLAALGELVPLEDGNLVSELLDDRLIALDLSAHGVDLGQQLRRERTQLFGRHLVEIGRRNHAVDFTKAPRLPQLKARLRAL